jgi:hypothetical protein
MDRPTGRWTQGNNKCERCRPVQSRESSHWRPLHPTGVSTFGSTLNSITDHSLPHVCSRELNAGRDRLWPRGEIARQLDEVESFKNSSAPTSLSTMRASKGNCFRVGSSTTFGALSSYCTPRVSSRHLPLARTFFTHSLSDPYVSAIRNPSGLRKTLIGVR